MAAHATRWIDISMPLFPGMPAFPGDPPFATELARDLAGGEPYSLSYLRLGSHAGTHVDPPSHFFSEGSSVDRLDLNLLQGPTYVVQVPSDCTAVGPAELRGIPPGTSRLLLRTGNSERWARRLEYFSDFVALTLAGARTVRELGIHFVGIDALSIESDPSETFPVHRDLLGHGIPILEGVLLANVRPGNWELACLPLRLRGGDGGPTRAAVRLM